MRLEVEFLCPHDGCTERGTKETIIRHMPECQYAASSVKACDGYYELRIDHGTAIILDVACARLECYDRENDFVTPDGRKALHVIHQQIIWAISGDPEMQRQAEAGRRDE